MPDDILKDWGEFPKVGLRVDGAKKFYSLIDAVPLWDSGWVKVEDTGELLESDGTVRTMTREENRAFQARADAYSGNK